MLVLRFFAFFLSSLVLVYEILGGPVVAPLAVDEPWELEEYLSLSEEEPELVKAYRVRMPRRAPALPGRLAAWGLDLRVANSDLLLLRVRVRNDFRGSGRGHLFARIRMGDQLLWQADVGSFMAESLTLPIGGNGVSNETISFEGFVNRKIDNFGVSIVFSDLQLSTDGGQTFHSISAVDLDTLPEPVEILPQRDLAAPRVSPEWLSQSRALQPWGRSQRQLFDNLDYWLPLLRDRYGFNTVVIASPDGHKGIVRGRENERISEDEFASAMEQFRAEGFRVVFYASLGHMGHSAEWHEDFGDVETKLPSRFSEWLQRTAQGDTINRYGGRWLSPITPAFDYQVDYFKDKIERWQPDGLMLDNHGFHFAGRPDQLTGHEGRATEWFRSFAADLVRDETWLSLPESPQRPNYPLWLEWRNRAIAKITEQFRLAMRSVAPSILVSANVAFDYSNPALANDYLMDHLDAVITENKVTPPAHLLAKVLFGRALSANIPQWSYMGTFNPRQPHLLSDPELITNQFSAAMAAGALPWVVFYGFDEAEENRPSREAIAEQMRRWQFLQDLQPWGDFASPVVSVVSTRERSFTGGLAMPLHVTQSPAAGYPLHMVRVDDLIENLDDETIKIVVLDDIRAVSYEEAKSLIRFVDKGGTLLATRESGWRDLLGRWRATGLLVQAEKNSDRIHTVVSAEHILSELRVLIAAPVQSNTTMQWSQLYRDGDNFWLHLAFTENSANNPTFISLSEAFHSYSPSWVCFDSQSLDPVADSESLANLSVPGRGRYHILFLENITDL
jgi:hypothetical protein